MKLETNYELLANYCNKYNIKIILAYNLEDQVETFL